MEQIDSLKELARRMRSAAEKCVRSYDAGLCIDKQRAEDWADVIDESLIPALEAAFNGCCKICGHPVAAADRGIVDMCCLRSLDKALGEAQAEIAALKEQFRLERVAVVLRASGLVPSCENGYPCKAMNPKFSTYCPNCKLKDAILDLLSNSDKSFAEAHDAEMWDRALEEAAKLAEGECLPYYSFFADKIRARKRGSK